LQAQSSPGTTPPKMPHRNQLAPEYETWAAEGLDAEKNLL
jgi:hypothetical protein